MPPRFWSSVSNNWNISWTVVGWSADHVHVVQECVSHPRSISIARQPKFKVDQGCLVNVAPFAKIIITQKVGCWSVELMDDKDHFIARRWWSGFSPFFYFSLFFHSFIVSHSQSISSSVFLSFGVVCATTHVWPFGPAVLDSLTLSASSRSTFPCVSFCLHHVLLNFIHHQVRLFCFCFLFILFPFVFFAHFFLHHLIFCFSCWYRLFRTRSECLLFLTKRICLCFLFYVLPLHPIRPRWDFNNLCSCRHLFDDCIHGCWWCHWCDAREGVQKRRCGELNLTWVRGFLEFVGVPSSQNSSFVSIIFEREIGQEAFRSRACLAWQLKLLLCLLRWTWDWTFSTTSRLMMLTSLRCGSLSGSDDFPGDTIAVIRKSWRWVSFRSVLICCWCGCAKGCGSVLWCMMHDAVDWSA